jgi:hypothetical protein
MVQRKQLWIFQIHEFVSQIQEVIEITLKKERVLFFCIQRLDITFSFVTEDTQQLLSRQLKLLLYLSREDNILKFSCSPIQKWLSYLNTRDFHLSCHLLHTLDLSS